MLNSDFGYPSLVPARPTYLPVCDCYTYPGRNRPLQGESPDEVIMLAEEFAAQADHPDFMAEVPRYLFRNQLSWSLTPIGER